MKKIAIYGKGGIGKSTTVSNLAVALTSLGYRVMQIGCDPKADSNIYHNGGKRINTVLDSIREGKTEESDFITFGQDGVLCIEAGGTLPGMGCAGRGIIAAFEKINELNLIEKYKTDVVLFDVLGDVVCGGFAMPIKNGFADEVYIVTSGEMMSLFAADNIIKAIHNNKSVRSAKFSGLIINKKNIENEDEIVERAAKEMEANIVYKIARNPLIQEAEKAGRTVVELYPESDIAKSYRELARILVEK